MFRSKSATNSILLIAEKILVVGMAFIVSVLLARIGGPELFGEYAYITSFVGLFAPLCIMGLNNIVTKYVVKYPANSHFYLSSALWVRGVGALVAIILAGLAILVIDKSQAYSFEVMLLVVCQGFNALLVYEYFFLAQKQVLPTLTIRVCILTFSNLAKLYIILTTPNLTMLVTIQGLEYMLIGLSYHLLYRNKQHQLSVKKQPSLNSASSLANKGKWLLLSGVAAVIYLKIDQVMLASMLGTEQVAYYAAAAKLSEFWYAFPILIANAYTAQFIETRKIATQKYQQLMTKLLALLVGTALTISVITFVLSPLIIHLVYGETFDASADILSIHIFASIFVFQRAIFSKWLIIENLLKYSLVTHGIGAILNVGLNYVLILHFGGIGAAWATLISYAAAGYISLVMFSKTRPFAYMMTKAMLTWPKLIMNKLRFNESYR